MTNTPLQSGAILVGRDGRPTAFFLRWLNELRFGPSTSSDDATTMIGSQTNSLLGRVAALERRIAELESQPTVFQAARPQAEDRVVWQGR